MASKVRKFFDAKASGDDKKKNKEVGKLLTKKNKEGLDVIKLLLLGAGETGKTTIFKQMQLSRGEGFKESYYQDMRNKLCANIMEGTASILQAMTEQDEYKSATEDENFQKAADTVMTKKVIYLGDSKDTARYEDRIFDAGELKKRDLQRYIDAETKAALEFLWGNDAFKGALDNLQRIGKYGISDTYDTIMEKLIAEYPTWGGESWLPTDDDILLARVRTTGFNDQEFVFKDVRFRLIDVGGQQSERRKWIHMFAGVQAVLYVAALSEYDQTLYEDNAVNRMTESIRVFDDYANREVFEQSAIILFLNKKDLFYKKFYQKKIPLNISGEFPEAPTANSSKEDTVEAIRYIEGKFVSVLSEERKESTFVYVTSALDRAKMDVVMEAVAQHILKLNMEASGIVTF